MAGCALFSEGCALGWLDGSAEDIAGAAERRLFSVNAGDVETLFGVEFAIGVAQAPTALWNYADAAPGAIGDREDFCEKFLRGAITVEGDDAAVGVLDFVTAGLELKDDAANAVEQIERLKAGDDERNAVLLREGRIFPVAHDAADVACQ